MSERHVLIVGAGLAGSLLACSLAREGHRVTLVERRPDPRRRGFIGGRSINLALSVRGITALRAVGLDDAILEDAIPMPGRMMHSPRGHLTFQPYSKNPTDAINSVSRGRLNLVLLEAADEHENVTLLFDARCVDVDLDAPAGVFSLPDGQTRRIEADALIGADGAFSAVRAALQVRDRFTYSQEYLSHGYKELTIPPGTDGGFAIEPNALHIWPRGGAMMIALPNADRSFTCTLFWPFSGPGGFDEVRTGDDAVRHFERWYPDAIPVMPTLREDYDRNPTSSLVTIRCTPWTCNGRVLILGDAAHAIVPFYGQGMNAAFEDVTILTGLLRRHAGDVAGAFEEFDRVRKPDADAIADMALQNFIEMRDLVGSRAFLWRKKLEKVLHRLLPGWYTPLYNLVSFSTMPYALARRRAAHQNRVVGFVLGVLVFVLALLLLQALRTVLA